MSVEFDFKSEANTSPDFLPSFNLGQHNLVKQIFILLEQ